MAQNCVAKVNSSGKNKADGVVRQIDRKRGASRCRCLVWISVSPAYPVCQTQRGRGWNNNSGVM